MQEESRWRYALAQQIASHYHANPKVAAVLVEGSVARDYADRSSDIDLAVFWAEPPTTKERRDIVKRAGEDTGTLRPLTEKQLVGQSATSEKGLPSTCATRRSRPPKASWLLCWNMLILRCPSSSALQPCALLFLSSTQHSSPGGSSKRLPIRTNWPWRWYGNTCASPRLGAGTAGRAQRRADPLRLLLYRPEAPPARPPGAQPPLLSWMAVDGSTDRPVAGDTAQPFPTLQTTLRHRQYRPEGLGLPAPRPH